MACGPRIPRMNPTPALAAFVMLGLSCPAARANADAEPAATGQHAEARVQRTVVEDEGTRIEELRVRGEASRWRLPTGETLGSRAADGSIVRELRVPVGG